MGVDGTIYYGMAVVINPAHISSEWKVYLNEYFSEREYSTLISIDAYSNPSDQLITFWATEPQLLFPPYCCERRPLVINNNTQLEIMKPTVDGPKLDDENLWMPSYGGFDIMTLQYKENSNELNEVLNQVIQRLNNANMSELISLIQTPGIRLVGTWIKFYLY